MPASTRFDWERFRKELGLTTTGSFYPRAEDRGALGKQLGLSRKTIERYELHGEAPKWYELALEGLAARRTGRVAKQKA